GREEGGGGRKRGGMAAQPRGDAGRRQHVELALVFQDVAGQREEDRAGRRRERGLCRAVHQARQVGDAVHLARPLDEGLGQARQVGREDRLGGHVILGRLAGGGRGPAGRRLRRR